MLEYLAFIERSQWLKTEVLRKHQLGSVKLLLTHAHDYVICTYNRGESLRLTLNHFFDQKGLSNIPYELIIVDNNSNDNTKELIHSYIVKYGDGQKTFKELFETYC